MSPPAFTPGPWEVREDGTDYYNGPDDCPRLPYSIEGGPCGFVLAVIIPDSVEEVCANAHLIAAAPDLYEALEAIDTMWSDDGEGGRADPIHARSGKVREIWTQLRSALAKARGEEIASILVGEG